jgi:bifunctional UDP-N-acetylglucosamine pyrophosphorylase/glucosamine-1-phosphate N-acetyltransferase
MGLAGVVMAAGEGRRMRSRTPKTLHRVCGKEMVRYPLDLLRGAGAERVVVVVSPENQDSIRAVLGDSVEYAVQPEHDGTAGALACCAPLLAGQAERVLVTGGDSPLVSAESVSRLLGKHNAHAARMTLLTAPGWGETDLGRVIVEEGRVSRIIEAAEAADGPSLDEHRTNGWNERANRVDVNAGVYCFEAQWLWAAIEQVCPSPSGERYLTALAAIGASGGAGVFAAEAADPAEAFGVNDRIQLAIVEEVMRQRIRERWMLAGVTMTDPASVYIEADVSIGMDTVILPNTMLQGRTSIGENCEIGPNSVIRDTVVGNECRVTSSALEEAVMEDHTDIGPFSHLRPGAYLESGVHIGNYVEVKESRFKAGAVMGHFGYAGDATIGSRVNVGAGMITCNYDGKDKHRTVVEDDAFIGCDTMLVAPVTVGEGSITGAGTVVTKDIPPARLAVGVPATIRRSLK